MASEYKDSVMVALLPTTREWTKIEYPHLTLVYAGKIPDLRPSVKNELAKAIVDFAERFNSLVLYVTGAEIFGEGDEKVEVLTFRPTHDLIKMRQHLDIYNASKYREFKPHATVGPIGSIDDYDKIPDSVVFNRVVLCWGEEKMTYPLR